MILYFFFFYACVRVCPGQRRSNFWWRKKNDRLARYDNRQPGVRRYVTTPAERGLVMHVLYIDVHLGGGPMFECRRR